MSLRNYFADWMPLRLCVRPRLCYACSIFYSALGTQHLEPSTFELTLTGMAHGGSALGRHDGRTVFVPYTIPGERIMARVTGEKGRVAFAEGVTLLEASADRVFPRCPHFGPGKCGRCQWQHIDYG